MEVRASRASAVVVQRVPAARADWFMEWQRGITAAAEGFPGYQGTDLYPPADNQREEWVVVIHFNDEKSLRAWLDSPVRAEWVNKLRTQVGDFELKALPGGFGPWFAGLDRRAAAAPPGWKMVLTVLLGLYPMVMLLAILVGPYTALLGRAAAMLIDNALSVCLLQWVVMPGLTAVLRPWLRADPSRNRRLAIGGVLVILCLLATLVLIFRQATG